LRGILSCVAYPIRFHASRWWFSFLWLALPRRHRTGGRNFTTSGDIGHAHGLFRPNAHSRSCFPVATAQTRPRALRVVHFKDGKVMLWTEVRVPATWPRPAPSSFASRMTDRWVAYLGTGSDGVYGIHVVNTDGTNQRLLVRANYLQTTNQRARSSPLTFPRTARRSIL